MSAEVRQQVDFTGRVAIVTGSGAGIGREIVTLLAARGAAVVVNDSAAAMADAVVEEIREASGKAVASHHPVGSSESAAAIVRTAEDAFGRIDVLVNNAGVDVPGDLDRLTDDQIERALATLLTGPFALMRAVWPGMRQRQYGRILNVCSAAVFGIAGRATYATGKAGLLGLTLSAAHEGRDQGILVNAFLPTAHTQMSQGDGNPYFLEHFGPEKVAPVAAYLVSDEVPRGGLMIHTAGGLTSLLGFVRYAGQFTTDPTIESVRDDFPLIVSAAGPRVTVEGTRQHQQLVLSEHRMFT